MLTKLIHSSYVGDLWDSQPEFTHSRYNKIGLSESINAGIINL